MRPHLNSDPCLALSFLTFFVLRRFRCSPVDSPFRRRVLLSDHLVFDVPFFAVHVGPSPAPPLCGLFSLQLFTLVPSKSFFFLPKV